MLYFSRRPLTFPSSRATLSLPAGSGKLPRLLGFCKPGERNRAAADCRGRSCCFRAV